uniref:C1q domain-containing protein n=1 Tax=Astyanax mexicanus TaxID=7994 RepID=A0A3B1IRH8_ASTMX
PLPLRDAVNTPPSAAPPMMPGSGSAFSATRSSSVLGGSQRAVTFDRLLVNVGSDFNPDTGRFRCQVPKLLSIMLVKNGDEI